MRCTRALRTAHAERASRARVYSLAIDAAATAAPRILRLHAAGGLSGTIVLQALTFFEYFCARACSQVPAARAGLQALARAGSQ